jgi:predicted RND superfamily exporter protein
LVSAFLVITLTMTIVEAGIISGILAMASNVFPIVIAFGWMGWLQHPMDIGSVMTASIALGIAVDDTLHFLAFFRRTVNQPGVSRFSAVLSAYQHCGVAMIQTSVSCGIGLMVFAFSDFVPTSRFAILMAILLLLALLGDLLLLPALLLSPAGRFFAPRSSRHSIEVMPVQH